ncbi:MAG: hypothetical protein NT145_04650, partial [Elusimicrobia bacterium]|nr:hypothetical protein [Elusimicrobiota bacterium]
MSFFVQKKIVIKILAIFFLVFSSVPAFSETTYIFDTPTKGMLDYANYNVDFRFFSDGGVLTRMSFGIFEAVNLGVGWEIENLVGTQ